MSIQQEDLKNFSFEDKLSYYPNPVTEELYLTWQLADNEVNYIQVFSITGQLLNSFKKNDALDNTQNISFYYYPSGIYLINLIYKDGKQKSIKVIKQ